MGLGWEQFPTEPGVCAVKDPSSLCHSLVNSENKD